MKETIVCFVHRNGSESMNIITESGMILLFCIIPYIVLLFSKKINRQFRLLHLSVRVVDLLIPYLFIMLMIIGNIALERNIIPHLIILLSIPGILMATYFTFKTQTLTFYLFFRKWWRVVFLILITLHLFGSGWLLMNYLI